MNRREKFVKLANSRVNKALKEIKLIGNLANKTYYEYTNADIDKMFNALKKEIRSSQDRFGSNNNRSEQSFSIE